MDMNDSRTPRDRIDSNFRNSLWEEEDRRAGNAVAASVCGCNGSPFAAGIGGNNTNTSLLSGQSLAMVISPAQKFTDIYEAEKALERGTIFAQLDLPFRRSKCPGRRCSE